MPAAFRALQRTSIAFMASLGHTNSLLVASQRATTGIQVFKAAYSSQSSSRASGGSDNLRPAMSGPWSSVRRAFVRTMVSRPFVAALGVAAVGTGVWVAQGQAWPHRRQLLSTAAGPAPRSVPSGLGVSGSDSAAISSESSDMPTLFLDAGAAMIPHPDKVAKGGEDAFFICDTGVCIGVADGVGGWAEIGVDPGLYSRELMQNAKVAVGEFAPGPDRPQRALEVAHSRTLARGSTTACILCVHEGKLHASNLGDSGFMVVRNGELAFMSPQQQHEFNFPYQIGSSDSMADLPTAAQRFTLETAPGDIIVLATDGVFDNVYPDEAAALVSLSKKRGDGPGQAATTLAEFTQTRAADPTHLSPFAYGAQQLGFRYFGGKMDDITVVCAYVEEKGVAVSKGVEGKDEKARSKL